MYTFNQDSIKRNLRQIKRGRDCKDFKKDWIGFIFGRTYCKHSSYCRWKKQGYCGFYCLDNGGECSGVKINSEGVSIEEEVGGFKEGSRIFRIKCLLNRLDNKFGEIVTENVGWVVVLVMVLISSAIMLALFDFYGNCSFCR